MPDSSSSGLTVVSKSSCRWHELFYTMQYQKSSKQRSGWKAPWTFFSATGICYMQVHQSKPNTFRLDLNFKSKNDIYAFRNFRLVSIAKFQTSTESSQKLSSAEVENIPQFYKPPCPERVCNGGTFCWTKFNSGNSTHEHKLASNKC